MLAFQLGENLQKGISLTQVPALAAMHFLMDLLDGLQLPSARPSQQVSPSIQHGSRPK